MGRKRAMLLRLDGADMVVVKRYNELNLNNKLVKVTYKMRVTEIAPDGSKAALYLSPTINLENQTYFYLAPF